MFVTALDVQFTFFCRTTHLYKNGESPIVFRVKYRGERRDIFTGLSCPPEFWFAEMGMVAIKHRQANLINRNLMDIQAKAQQKFDLLLLKNEEFSIDELIEIIRGKTPPPQTILEYIEIKEKELMESIGTSIAKTTWYKYKRTIKYFKCFLEEKRKVQNLPVSKIDDVMVEQFFNYLKKEKNNCHNSASALMGCMSGILMPAIKNKVIKYNPFMQLKLARNEVFRDFLEMDEIIRLQELTDLSTAQQLHRDIFVFCIYTGLPYGDIRKLNKELIKKDPDGTYYIVHGRTKSKMLGTIPLLPL